MIPEATIPELQSGKAWVFPQSLVYAIEHRKRMEREIARSELAMRLQVGMKVS